ncbi:NAD-dependent epimerase/dehydratase [Amycolatopsis sp. OK19-0408]|uniref:NAD-dependent epimerase/dehydratase n=1 Tax=Amycolatopsis iheyensis TaxID=2945988 RepID=A0A9X2NL25_9PSEU|nr:NAD-dependent epimerase/dehydratase [Amycolatopsis iheyensis]MCR6488750.1 NAD-dependent epimerase/dehydratase [Amycolatopsis iheyensis]
MSDEHRPLVAVLGGSGFVGAAVVEALARRPIRLRTVGRRPQPAPAGAVAEVEVVRADLTARAELEAALAGVDTVVHLLMHTADWRAADGNAAAEQVNVGVLRDVVELLGNRERPPVIVFAGSTSQAGLPERMPMDGSEPDRPTTAYDVQKHTAEQLLKAATAAGLVRGVSLRLPTVYGDSPRGRLTGRGVISTMVRKAFAGEELTLWNDGTVERDLLYVHDAAAAFVAGIDHADALAGRHWLLGTGQGVPLGDVLRTIAALVGDHLGRPPAPVVCVAPPDFAKATDLNNVSIDSSKFRAVTGWQPRVPLADALRRCVDAYAATASASLK